MEVKNSKVMSVQANGSWEGNYGVMYKFEIVFQNGDVGEYSSKSQAQNKFEQGAETEYEYHAGQFPKIKPHYSKPQGGFSGGGTPAKSFGKSDDVQTKIVRQSMLKASVDFHAINPELKPSEIDVLKTAERFVAFVNGNSETQLPKEWKQEAMIDRGEKTNDLPF
ncbi:MAG: hypothetical protein Unbinned3205contig1001_21 [Prokaryotic dsDNA virus sp.]|nr:MAG: hypothetical protein Unbinned3205contig1001_21 [Prokaryotic dsDNA virus sp.]|tara:strand:- start:666 stop:1160 length:495 start_codon:yes stop_codon:yes gene_type:complete